MLETGDIGGDKLGGLEFEVFRLENGFRSTANTWSMSLKGKSGLHGNLVARVRSCAKAALRSLPSSSTSRYSRCRTLVTASSARP